MNAGSLPNGIGTIERAQALHDAGRHIEAEAVLLEAHATDVPSAAGYRLLAAIERALDRPQREALALEQALAIGTRAERDDTVWIWSRLGAIRARLGDVDGSVAACDSAARAGGPADTRFRQNLARTQLAQQDLDGMQRSVEELLQLSSESATSHLLAGHLHKARGDVRAAERCYARALELEPTCGEALYNLVDLAIPAADDAMTVRAAELASRDDLPAADRINAGFAHARILDRAGFYADAFESFRRANDLARNELARQGIRHVPARVESRAARTIAAYSAPCFRTSMEPLAIDLKPIFIIGMPRSGTTLIEQILASHRDVESGGELLFARECEQRFRQDRIDAGRDGPVDPADPADAELLATARECYVEALFERDLNGPWIVDKLPANFEIAGFLRLLFPEAPIVHSVRDARATCFSLYCANFGAHEPWYHDLGHLAHYHGHYRRLMTHWYNVIPGRFIDVVYEDVVRDSEVQIAALLEAIGLSFDQACVDFHRHERPIQTASHAGVRRPIYSNSIDHWRHYADWLGPLRHLPST